MFAVIKTGGKQYKVSKGDILDIEKLPQKEGEEVVFDQVLLFNDGKNVKIGRPVVEGAVVKAEIIKHGKDKKQIAFKYKSKKRSRQKKGHRQPFSTVKIKELSA